MAAGAEIALTEDQKRVKPTKIEARTAFRYPSYVQEFMGNVFSLGFGFVTPYDDLPRLCMQSVIYFYPFPSLPCGSQAVSLGLQLL